MSCFPVQQSACSYQLPGTRVDAATTWYPVKWYFTQAEELMNIHNHHLQFRLDIMRQLLAVWFCTIECHRYRNLSLTQRAFVVNEFKCKLLQRKLFLSACYFFNSGLEYSGVVINKKNGFPSTHRGILLKWSTHVYSWRKWEKLFLIKKKVWDNFLQRTLSKVPIHRYLNNSWNHNLSILVFMLDKWKPFSLLVDIKLHLSLENDTVTTCIQHFSSYQFNHLKYLHINIYICSVYVSVHTQP